MKESPRHQCLIYEGSPAHQLPALALMIQKKLNDGFRCLYLNKAQMLQSLRSYLEFLDVDVAGEITKQRLVLSSELVTSADGTFDTESMLRKIEGALDQAIRDGHVGLFATGDMSFEFGHERNFSKLLDYEYGLEQLFQRRKELHGICQYHVDTLPGGIANNALMTHSSIFINETLSRINPHYSPFTTSLSRKKNVEFVDAIEEICALTRKAKT